MYLNDEISLWFPSRHTEFQGKNTHPGQPW